MPVSSRGLFKLILAVVLSALLGFLAGRLTRFSGQSLSFIESSSGRLTTQASFADVAERVNASVVSVISTRMVDINEVHEGMDVWTPFRPDSNGQRKSRGFGSGFIVDAKGLIVTNQHVIEDSRNIAVRLYDGSTYPAEVLGIDEQTDLALMRVRPKNRLMPVQLGDSSQLRVGDWVMAVGNPYNYDHTVTVGVVSAKDRKIDENPYERYIQTDAAINFGSSGGPLFNARGQVVAINTAISARGRGIGFAIPINFARRIVGQLEARGRVIRGFLGLQPEGVTEEHAQALHLESARGILVAEVSPLSAAEAAGVRRYDVITEVAGKPILERDDFFRAVAEASPGTRIHLKGIRNQQPVHFDVTVRERPLQRIAARTLPAPVETSQPLNTGRLGIAVQEITEHRRNVLRLDSKKGGVLIVEVDPLGPAAEVSLSPGELILEMNQRPVRTLADYQQVVTSLKAGDVLMLLVSRPSGSSRIVTLKLGDRS